MLSAWCSEVLRPFHTALSLLLVFTMTVCLHLASKWLGYLTQPAKKCSFARQLGAVNCTTRRHFLGHVLQLCRFLFTLPRGSLRELVRRRERWTTPRLQLMCWQTHRNYFFFFLVKPQLRGNIACIQLFGLSTAVLKVMEPVTTRAHRCQNW